MFEQIKKLLKKQQKEPTARRAALINLLLLKHLSTGSVLPIASNKVIIESEMIVLDAIHELFGSYEMPKMNRENVRLLAAYFMGRSGASLPKLENSETWIVRLYGQEHAETIEKHLK